jgi:hypothetical protein
MEPGDSQAVSSSSSCYPLSHSINTQAVTGCLYPLRSLLTTNLLKRPIVGVGIQLAMPERAHAGVKVFST